MSMLSIGEMLKNARENKSLTIEQVQKQTRVHSSVLRALEEGRCDEILTAAYVRSFLKKYSDYLKLDTSAILKEYSALRPEPSGYRDETTRPIDRTKYLTYAYRVVMGLVILAAIFATIFVGKKMISAIFRKKSDVRQVSVSQKQKAETRSTKHQESKPMTRPDPSRVSEESSKNVSFSMVLKVKRNVYVKLRKDGKLIFERVLTKGTEEALKANDKIELYVAKAEVIEITIDGKSFGSPGRGIIKNLEITKKGVRVR